MFCSLCFSLLYRPRTRPMAAQQCSRPIHSSAFFMLSIWKAYTKAKVLLGTLHAFHLRSIYKCFSQSILIFTISAFQFHVEQYNSTSVCISSSTQTTVFVQKPLLNLSDWVRNYQSIGCCCCWHCLPLAYPLHYRYSSHVRLLLQIQQARWCRLIHTWMQ